MGCDIHAFVEFHDESKDQWFTYKALDIPRNYSLFYKLAGVRGSEGKHFPVKGFPPNISHTVQLYWNQMPLTYHTRSWLGEYELSILKSWMVYQPWYSYYEYEINNFGYIFGSTILQHKGLFMRYPDVTRIHNQVDTYRMTFWFDN